MSKKVKLNYTEWEERQREMRSLEDFHRAPNAVVEFTPYPTEEETQARMAAERAGDKEYEDDERIYDMELTAANEELEW